MISTHKNYSDLRTNCDLHNYYTRGRENILINKHFHSFYERSPFYNATKLYNALPPAMKKLGLNIFKKKVKEILKYNVLYDVNDFFDICSSIM